MTLDLSLIKKGAKLHLRDGSVLVCGPKAYATHETIIYDGVCMIWCSEGYIRHPEQKARDIIRIEPAPEPVKIVGYINVNENKRIFAYSTLKDAHDYRSPNRIDCLEITYTVGQGATVRSVLNDA